MSGKFGLRLSTEFSAIKFRRCYHLLFADFRLPLTFQTMKNGTKKLSLGDLFINRRGSIAARFLHIVFGIALSLFFRRIELFNAEKIPKNGGLIFVSNHPNALIDPALLFAALPRPIAFLAKSTLFKIPVLGFLLRVVGALPLYRQQDAGADVSKNQKTFAVVRELLKSGGAAAIFPEGISHNETKLQPLKTGAARIALGALGVREKIQDSRFEIQDLKLLISDLNLESQTLNLESLKIMPVGLFYTNKTTFRSEALLHFGDPIPVSPIELEDDGQPPKNAVKILTEKIEKSLRDVTVNAESETQLATARIAEEIFTSFTGSEENLAERQKFLRDFVAGLPRRTNAALEKQLADYDRKLARFGIEPEFLALARYSKRFVFRRALVRLWFLILLAPLALVGIIIHFPAYQICRFLAFTQTKKGDFDMASTVKFLAGLILIPLTWLALACLFYYFGYGKTALASIPAAFFSGYVALRTLEEIEELSGWAKAIVLFFRKREKFLRLLAKRRDLQDELRDANRKRVKD